MWPNELALFIVELFNLTSDEAKGVAVMVAYLPYAFAVILAAGAPCIYLERMGAKAERRGVKR